VTTRALAESNYVILDGSGNGTVQLRPDGSREIWHPTLASVKVNTNVAEASCKIYIGHKVSDDNFVDQTLSGSSGDSSGKVTGRTISRTSDPAIFAVWAGGDPGSQATLIVTGSKELPL
jgi:hypothetical protein